MRRKILFLGYIVGALAITWSTATATKIFVAVLSMQVCAALFCVVVWRATLLGLVVRLQAVECSVMVLVETSDSHLGFFCC